MEEGSLGFLLVMNLLSEFARTMQVRTYFRFSPARELGPAHWRVLEQCELLAPVGVSSSLCGTSKSGDRLNGHHQEIVTVEAEIQ